MIVGNPWLGHLVAGVPSILAGVDNALGEVNL
jgi:hypothetical protein